MLRERDQKMKDTGICDVDDQNLLLLQIHPTVECEEHITQ